MGERDAQRLASVMLYWELNGGTTPLGVVHLLLWCCVAVGEI